MGHAPIGTPCHADLVEVLIRTLADGKPAMVRLYVGNESWWLDDDEHGWDVNPPGDHVSGTITLGSSEQNIKDAAWALLGTLEPRKGSCHG